MSHDEQNEPPTPPFGSSFDVPNDLPGNRNSNASDLEMSAYNLLGPPLHTTTPSETPDPNRPPRIGHPILAWLFITCLVTFIVGMHTFVAPDDEAGDEPQSDGFRNLVWEFQGKLIVGMSDFVGGMPQDQLTQDIRSQFDSTFDGRLRMAVLFGELEAFDAARTQLSDLEEDISDEGYDPSQRQMQASDILARLYADYAEEAWQAPSVDDSERDLIADELGWYGQLALAPKGAPEDTARRAVLTEARTLVAAIIIAALFMFIIGMCGIAGCALFAALMLSGKLQRRLIAGAPHGGVYAETFAMWMAFFLVFTMTAEVVSSVLDLGEARFIPTLLAMFASLLALAWPVMRGVPWRQVRRDIGWSGGHNPLVEMLAGAAGWVSTIPLVVVGVMMMFVLILISGLVSGGGGEIGAGPEGPSHPIVEWLADSDWRGKLQLLLLACVAAPIVEETMFRGVLYRQLRDATVGWRIGISVLMAALLNSFVFAVIHPQGWLAVPTLMSLAIGFSLLREWRGSLIASMTAHGINNAVATSVFLVFF